MTSATTPSSSASTAALLLPKPSSTPRASLTFAQLSTEVEDIADATAGIRVDGREAVPLSQVVARFLPQVEAVCNGPTEVLQDAKGRPLPPCIVMEREDSLQDWSDRAKHSFTALGVRAHT